MFRYVFQLLILPLPWDIRRRLLGAVLGYRLAPDSVIGFSIVAPDELVMGPGARIGHLNLIRGMQRVEMGRFTIISNLNWIYAIHQSSPALAHETDRRTELIMGEHSAVVSRHIIDCSAPVVLGRYSTVTGMRSLLLTHSADLRAARLRSRPIHIGDYGVVGAACTILDGSVLPNRSVLGAGSVMRTAATEELRLYSGVPAVVTGPPLPEDLPVFSRETGAMPGYYVD